MHRHQFIFAGNNNTKGMNATSSYLHTELTSEKAIQVENTSLIASSDDYKTEKEVSYASTRKVETSSSDSSSNNIKMQQTDASGATIQMAARLLFFPNKDTQNNIDEGKEL